MRRDCARQRKPRDELLDLKCNDVGTEFIDTRKWRRTTLTACAYSRVGETTNITPPIISVVTGHNASTFLNATIHHLHAGEGFNGAMQKM
jgi:predicted metal-dependent RNase